MTNSNKLYRLYGLFIELKLILYFILQEEKQRKENGSKSRDRYEIY